jgi:hypothetical protein
LLAGASVAADPAEIARGKLLFTTLQPACAVCHTLQAAGAEGQIGPVLDELKPDADRVLRALRNGKRLQPLRPFWGLMPPWPRAPAHGRHVLRPFPGTQNPPLARGAHDVGQRLARAAGVRPAQRAVAGVEEQVAHLRLADQRHVAGRCGAQAGPELRLARVARAGKELLHAAHDGLAAHRFRSRS